ncbi:MAG: hypothetical protein LV479_00250 [Methylacidiphilales bacterium]|nr:hypothetical protein [Candidatus Methylacidiphilales bacterium]
MKRVIGVALTWDGARQPVRSLPAKARAFLGEAVAPSPRRTAQLLAGDKISEIRICWVPRLRGGDEVLAEPFATSDGKRVPFMATRIRPLGDHLGVVYRRRN